MINIGEAEERRTKFEGREGVGVGELEEESPMISDASTRPGVLSSCSACSRCLESSRAAAPFSPSLALPGGGEGRGEEG
jgi:hypothetical protein